MKGGISLVVISLTRRSSKPLKLSLISASMIRVAGQYHFGSVELFGQHCPAEHMWPDRASKGDLLISFLQQIGMMSIRAANRKKTLRDTVSPPLADHICQFFRTDINSIWVKADQAFG